MRVLAIASEMHPLMKTGGLADVVGALPAALLPEKVQVTTLLPAYPQVLRRIGGPVRTVKQYADLFGGPARIRAARVGDARLFLLDAPRLFAREGPPYTDAHGNDWPDNWQRFAALSRAGADIAAGTVPRYRPDIVHAHDWQGALAMAYMRFGPAARVPSVLTIHNIAFQGRFPATIFPALDLPDRAFAVDGVEYYGGVGYLKAGIWYADAITTVSPTYAAEIREPAFGMGLEGLIDVRSDALTGIVNGIDTAEWNPETDAALASRFSMDTLKKRSHNRRALIERFGLDVGDGPLFVVVSRLTWQKGMDLLVDATDTIVALGGSLAVLGSGDASLESGLLAAAARHPGRVAVDIGYDEALSHLMQGGGDAILVPSRFEPCGLTQLYGLRYGCVPVVARTGGLADTIIDANTAALAAGVATGLHFRAGDGAAFHAAIRRAAELFAMPKIWAKMQQQGMRADFSWKNSASRYSGLYTSLIAARNHA
ncbi:MAG: glycogen synthase GlgA [Sphingomonadaceae bacterium]